MTCGIYKIQNKINGKIYIGQSIHIEERWQQHRNNSRNKNSKKTYYPLYCSMRKYGIENFDFSILEDCAEEELNEKEKYWIEFYSSMLPNGYNHTLGGSSSIYKISKEDLLLLLKDLENKKLTNNFIAKKYNISESYLHLINIGKNRKISNINYPIRPAIKRASYDESIMIKKDLQDNILSYEELSKKYN